MAINKNKKHDHLLILAASKFNSIETLISQVNFEVQKRINLRYKASS